MNRSLRLATEVDLPDVCAMVAMYCHEEMPKLPISPERIAAAVTACYGQQGIMVAESREGDVVGTLGVVRTHPFWSDNPWMVCLWSYVKPPHRKFGHLSGMFEAVNLAAKSQNMILRFEVWFGSGSRGRMTALRRGMDCDAAGAILTTRG